VIGRTLAAASSAMTTRKRPSQVSPKYFHFVGSPG
jgi:hypothetical protein